MAHWPPWPYGAVAEPVAVGYADGTQLLGMENLSDVGASIAWSVQDSSAGFSKAHVRDPEVWGQRTVAMSPTGSRRTISGKTRKTAPIPKNRGRSRSRRLSGLSDRPPQAHASPSSCASTKGID